MTADGGVKPDGRVKILVDGKVRRTAQLTSGKVVVRLPRLKVGPHRVRATYLGSATTEKSSSKVARLVVVKKR